ncbi:hypothetical protein P3T18_002721 [Paraburkholderia sp. GAS199]|uniref:hypothetical protein n=1 Tax=Paraburkholderia sp. GAS199 TaxID=3035126 RepID=UPI003D25159D
MRTTLTFCHRLLASVLLVGATLHSSVAREDSSEERTRVAGARAHFAQEFCGIPKEKIAQFKESIRKKFADSKDFDAHWQAGWKQEERDAGALRAARLGDPAEYAERVKTSCSRVKWQAEKSIRQPEQK